MSTRDALIEALTVALGDRTRAEVALSVVEEWTPTKPCPECGGTGRVVSQEGSYQAGAQLSVDCRPCHATGRVASDVPGIIELLCEQAGKINEWENGERRMGRMRDPDRTEGPMGPFHRGS